MDYAAACRALGVPVDPELAAVHARFPVEIPPYYLGLIDRDSGSSGAVWRECMPDVRELQDAESSFDPLSEQRQSVAPRLIRRFKDRAVLLSTGRCAMHCRFCFRKRFWADGAHLADIGDGELAAAADFLRRTPEIKEVLISGGDPLVLSLERLKKILDAVSAVPNVEVIRIGSRVPVVNPELATDEAADLIASYPGTWLMTHFNTVEEVTSQSVEACRKFLSRGVPVLNQAVLLRGVNDTPEQLEILFRALIRHRIKPHYLFHVDPVLGVRHFATGIDRGLEILRKFRNSLSSLGVPTFAIDLPGGGGKVALQPDYRCGAGFLGIDGAEADYPDK